MKKIVKTIFSNDNRVRRTRDFNIEIYSHDRNNAGFEFVIKNETDLSKYVPKFLFHFLDSRSYWETQGTIEGNKVSVKFDTELITRSEEVLGYLTLDSETDDIDAFKFRFNVVLSEIDKDSTVKKEFRFIKDSVVIDAVTTKELEDVKSKLAERITILENKADKDTVYDDTDLQKRVKAIEDKPEVDVSKLATKDELKEVSNRQVTVDTSNLIKKEEFDSELDALRRNLPYTLYQTFDEPTVPEYLKGVVELALKPRPITISAGQLLTDREKWYIAKGDLENEKYVNFHATLYSLANSLPDFYNLEDVEKDIDNNNVIFLTNKNFADYSSGAIDNLATRDELNALELTYMPRGMVEVVDYSKDFPTFIKENLDAERVNNGEYLGRLFNNGKSITRVLKQKNGDEFEFVYFEGAMITLANILPKDYDYQAFNDPEKRVTLLTDRNFKEMVATPEFKAVVNESLRDIVKEIIKEEN